MNMKNYTKALIVVAAVCGIIVLSSCKKTNDYSYITEVERIELLRTDKSWDGVKLPDYPQGSPEIVAMKYVIPVGQKLEKHHHDVLNHGVLVQGELTIVGLDGKTKVLREGEVIVEMVNSVHHGENRGKDPVVLYMFYVSQKGLPLSVSYPDILQD